VSHRRRNPLTDEWVLVSPQRLARPWRGATDDGPPQRAPQHDPTCALCPRSTRTSGAVNPDYTGVFVFENDHPALALTGTRADERVQSPLEHALFASAPERGRCDVVCFSEHHDVSPVALGASRIAEVLALAAERTEENARAGFGATVLFENRGAQMGASSPHPHGQLWAQETPPTLLVREEHAQQTFHEKHGACLLCALWNEENARGSRIVWRDEETIAIVPFWATWPFEALVFPRAHADAIGAITNRHSFATALVETWTRMDALFGVPMPLSWGLHQAPVRPAAHGSSASFHVHAHVYPPLLRSATVRKWMVGYEMLGEAQRDLLPETAAERLRAAAGAVQTEAM
jgi:UDPglucose--hexose-1-phosphate uridylyltransferase